MNTSLFMGQKVCLKGRDPEQFAALISRWGRDSEYQRLLDSDVPRMVSKKRIQEWIEKDLIRDPYKDFLFIIHTLADDRPIGFAGLDGISWADGDCFTFIGLGERDYWGKGYGTDAMRIILRYAFTELNMHRVTLDVFDYNPRAIRSYEKAGFAEEGRMRALLNREGRRYDLIFMGILREDWERSAPVIPVEEKIQ